MTDPSDPREHKALPGETAGSLGATAPKPDGRDRLEHEKLELEIQALKDQRSTSAKWIEFLKAAAIPAAFLSIAISAYSAITQFDEEDKDRHDRSVQAEETANAARFAKALEGLAASNTQGKNVGVSELRIFGYAAASPEEDPVQASHRLQRQEQALQFLVGALAAETDPVVQDAIQEVFWDMPLSDATAPVIPKVFRDAALTTAAERSRGAVEGAISEGQNNLVKARADMMADLLGQKPGSVSSPVSQELIDRLATEHPEKYTEFLDIDPWPLDRLDPLGWQSRLGALSGVITTLSGHGAVTENLSGIYCSGCDFHTLNTWSLQGETVSFSNAFLSTANFQHRHLEGVAFDSADIAGTDFTGAYFDKDTSFAWNAETDSGPDWDLSVAYGLNKQCCQLRIMIKVRVA